MSEFNNPFNDILYTNLTDMSEKEHDKYIEKVKENNQGALDNVKKILVEKMDNDMVGITYFIQNSAKFERIRRITGYLTGTLDRWNNAKKAEEHDRVKHV